MSTATMSNVNHVGVHSSGKELGGIRQKMVKHFRVEHTLGSGLQGKVKLGINTETQERVALKIVDTVKLKRKTIVNLYREVEAMTRVQHKNVLKLIGVFDNVTYTKKNGSSKQVIVIVLELATGGELFDFMMYTGRFSESIARAYFQQLVFGLAECHAKGVYHRDIKPENLLLDEKFMLKIADFGLSGLRKNENGGITELYTQCGTRSYMSPEILSGLPYEGEPADVWSAGVVLFIMLSGFPPFQIANRQDWWFRAAAANQFDAFWAAHSRSATFSPGAVSLLSRMFCVTPTERITLHEIQTHPWFNESDISHEILRVELLERKRQVEEEKRREKAEKARQKQVELAQNQEVFDPFDMNVMRSVASSINVEVAESHRRHDISSVALSTVSEYIPGDKCSKCGVAAPFYPDTNVTLYTSFQSAKCPKIVQSRIEEALSDLSIDFTSKQDRFKTKAQLRAPENVDFCVRIFALPAVHGLNIVEVHRTAGNLFVFQEMYQKFNSKLSDLVYDFSENNTKKTEVEIESNTDDDQDSLSEELISDEALMI